MPPPPPRSTLFPYTTLFRSHADEELAEPELLGRVGDRVDQDLGHHADRHACDRQREDRLAHAPRLVPLLVDRSEEHTSELQSLRHLVCRLLLEKKKQTTHTM